MLWPGIKKLGKELNLKRTDSEVVGIIKNCFVKLYDGNNMKVLELFVPEMDENDKKKIIEKLESNKIKKYEWRTNGVKIIFVELVKPYSIQKIRGLLEELVNYFYNKYPVQKQKCQHCGAETETETFCVDNAAILICNDCYRQYENNIKNYNTEQQNLKGNYLLGFLGAIIFAVPGILLTTLFFVFLKSLAAVSAAAYILLGILGYKKFKGKISPVGAVVIILAGLIMVGIGTTIAYSVFILVEIYKNIKMIDIDSLFEILKLPEIQNELKANMFGSYLISAIYFSLQLSSMVKDWKSQKSISKLKEI